MKELYCNRPPWVSRLVLLYLVLLANACGGGGDNASTGGSQPVGIDATEQPATTPVPSDGIDYDEIDPATLPITLTPIEPIVSRPEGVSVDNQPPYFEGLTDQIIYAGEQMNLVLAARDPEEGVAGQFIDYLPPGLSYVDNEDGTRSLLWRPLQPDVGIIAVTITAVDPAEAMLRTSHTIRIQVVMPDDPSTIVNLAPALNKIDDYVIRSGDDVTLHVRAEDPNGTFGTIEALNPPAGSTFMPHPTEEDIYVLDWPTSSAQSGTVTLNFKAIDALDPALTHEASGSIRLADPAEFDLSGATLRSLADARDFWFGYASAYEWVNRPDADLYADVAAREFNIVSTENSLKWGLVHPTADEYDWEDADRVVAFAKEHDMVIHGHPLVWHRQLPKWVQKLPSEDRRNAMLAFIRNVVNRYNNDVAIWDVVNEALEEDGSFRQSAWFEAMGEDYIRKAFTQARLYAPTATLLYNDYDVAWESPKSDAMYQLVQDLLAEGIPLDGVGFQMHLSAAFDQFDSAERNLQRFAALGLDIYITELDVSIFDAQTEQQQVAVYRDILELCLSIPRCKAVQTWGFTDRYSWRKDYAPLIFDREYQPKAAYFALRSVLQQ